MRALEVYTRIGLLRYTPELSKHLHHESPYIIDIYRCYCYDGMIFFLENMKRWEL